MSDDGPGDEFLFDDEDAVSSRALEGLDTEALLQRAIDEVGRAKRAPLSASVLVAREELLDVLEAAAERLPEELRRARRMLKDHEEILAQRRREADVLLEEVRAQAERMVQRTEIVRQANQVAQRILDDAREQSRRLRHDAEDFCDQRLASFEIVLDRTLKTVQAGREHLQAVPGAEPVTTGPGVLPESPDSDFFDQDEE